jgi:hypothetical protein
MEFETILRGRPVFYFKHGTQKVIESKISGYTGSSDGEGFYIEGLDRIGFTVSPDRTCALNKFANGTIDFEAYPSRECAEKAMAFVNSKIMDIVEAEIKYIRPNDTHWFAYVTEGNENLPVTCNMFPVTVFDTNVRKVYTNVKVCETTAPETEKGDYIEVPSKSTCSPEHGLYHIIWAGSNFRAMYKDRSFVCRQAFISTSKKDAEAFLKKTVNAELREVEKTIKALDVKYKNLKESLDQATQ